MLFVLIISIIFSYLYINFINYKYENINIKETGEYIGTIVSEVIEKDYSYVYTLKLDSVDNKKYKDINVLLYVKKKDVSRIYRYGDYVSIKGEFQKGETKRNYGGFDYELYLRKDKICGVIRTGDIKVLDNNKGSLVNKYIVDIRKSITEKSKEVLPRNTSGLMLAMLIGKTDTIAEEYIESFRTSSLSHILAVSGGHTVYVILIISFILNKINIKKKISYLIIIICLIIFMFLTGASGSVIRACIMASIIMISKIFHRKLDIYTSISGSLLILLIINPYNIQDIGLLLSYGGTIGIVLFNKTIGDILNKFIKMDRKIFRVLKETASLTISAQIVIAPITMFYFNILSLTFFVSNILSSFLIGIITIFSFISIVFSYIFIPISLFIGLFLNFLLELLILISKLGSWILFSNIIVITPNIFFVAIYYLSIVLLNYIYELQNIKDISITQKKQLLLISKTKKYIRVNMKKIVLYIISIAILIQAINLIPKDLEIYFIDVGQGDSNLVITPTGKKVLIDGGGVRDNTYDVGEKVLVPYLLDRGITKLDCVMISHFDADHCNGLIAVFEKLKVEKVIISKQTEMSWEYQNIIEIIKRKNIPAQIVQKGDTVVLDRYTYLDILYPDFQISEEDLNNNSIVAKLNYVNFSMLFTGDIEKPAEQYLINMYKETNLLNSTILKIPHHGSKSSSTELFLDTVKPKIALIGVGANNTFRAPCTGSTGPPKSNTVVKYLEQTCVVKLELK